MNSRGLWVPSGMDPTNPRNSRISFYYPGALRTGALQCRQACFILICVCSGFVEILNVRFTSSRGLLLTSLFL